MVKTVHRKAGFLNKETALAFVGWIAFTFGLWLRPHSPMFSIFLSAVARVLP